MFATTRPVSPDATSRIEALASLCELSAAYSAAETDLVVAHVRQRTRQELQTETLVHTGALCKRGRRGARAREQDNWRGVPRAQWRRHGEERGGRLARWCGRCTHAERRGPRCGGCPSLREHRDHKSPSRGGHPPWSLPRDLHTLAEVSCVQCCARVVSLGGSGGGNGGGGAEGKCVKFSEMENPGKASKGRKRKRTSKTQCSSGANTPTKHKTQTRTPASLYTKCNPHASLASFHRLLHLLHLRFKNLSCLSSFHFGGKTRF